MITILVDYSKNFAILYFTILVTIEQKTIFVVKSVYTQIIIMDLSFAGQR